MKKILLAVILSFSALYPDNNIIIVGGEDDFSTVNMLIKGNGEECKVSSR